MWHGDVVETAAILNVKMSSSNVWFCPLCEWFAGASMKAVVRHIGANHAHEAGFHVCCGIDGCPRTYKKFDSYRHHLYKIHRDVLDVSSVCYNDPEEQGGSNPEEQGGSNQEDSMEDYCDSDPNVQSDFHNSFPLTLKRVGLFLLKAKEIYKVAETHLGSLMEDISFMIDLTVSHLEKAVQNVLKDMGIAMSCDLKSIFHLPQLKSVFDQLRTKAQQQRFIDDNLEVVVSCHLRFNCDFLMFIGSFFTYSTLWKEN